MGNLTRILAAVPTLGALAFGALVAWSPGASAEGGAPGPARSGYLGRVLPLGGDMDRDGPLLSVPGAHVATDPDGLSLPRRFRLNEPAADVMLGYQWLVAGSRLSAYLGPRFRSLDPDFDISGDSPHRQRLGLAGLLELHTDMPGGWDLGLTGSYSAGFNDYLLRLRPAYRLSEWLTVGPEASVLGGDDYDKVQFGLFARGYESGAANLGLKLGLERDIDRAQYDGYLGMEFEQRF